MLRIRVHPIHYCSCMWGSAYTTLILNFSFKKESSAAVMMYHINITAPDCASVDLLVLEITLLGTPWTLRNGPQFVHNIQLDLRTTTI